MTVTKKKKYKAKSWHFQINVYNQSKKKGKYQDSIQSSTTPDPGYQWESDNFTIRHHKP